MGKGVWGIDVGKSSVKAVRLEGSSREGLMLTDLEVAPYKAGGRLEDADLEGQIKEALKDLKYSKKIRGERVVISLPTHSAFNRLIKLPPVDDPIKAIQFEAQSQIPMLDQVVWGYQIIEREYQAGEEKEVALLALKKDIIDSFLQNIDEIGLDIECVQLSPVALYNFLAFDQDMTQPTIVLDMGGDNSSLVVMENERFWIRNLPVTGHDLTKQMMETFNLPYEKAEALKVKANQSQHVERIYEALVPVYKNIISEIHRSLGYYKSMSRQARFERVLLLGNGTKALNFQRFISQALQIPATRLQKLGNISMSDTVDPKALTNSLQSLGTALGLALQGLDLTKNKVNLLPALFLKKRSAKKKYPWLIASVIILYVALYFLYSDAGKKAQALEGVVANATQVFELANKQKADYAEASNTQELEAAVKRVTSLSSVRDPILKIIEAVQKNLPQNGNPTVKDQDKIWIVRIKCETRIGDEKAPGTGQPGQQTKELSKERKLICTFKLAVTRYMVEKISDEGTPRAPDAGSAFIKETLFSEKKLDLQKLGFKSSKIVDPISENHIENLEDDSSGQPPPDEALKFQLYTAKIEVDLADYPTAPVPPAKEGAPK